ncbi:hypothetical protein EI94DRAFT_1728195 [Lactarius quietus]|nr:hypothetical protein EI94DRAFT_1728195 [Lactarius quietus]
MGKNKNKGFDMAKRQEKILKRMAQPLYKQPTDSDSVYLVITEPFGMHQSPAVRGTVDINRLSSWISWVFRRPSVLEAVYTMSTRDEVIIKISEGLDVTLMLGKHRYCNILNRGWADPDAASCVFEYDYPTNGDPSAHQWREHIALDAPVPPGHFRDPYPAPTWTFRPPLLASLALPLPNSVPRSRPPSPGPSSATLNPTQQGNVEREPNLYSRKRDEPDKVKSTPGSVKVEPSSGHPTASVKSEEPAYEPDQALRDEIARLNGSGHEANIRVKEEQTTQYGRAAQGGDLRKTPVDLSDSQSLSVKQEPRDVPSESLGPATGPSQALLDEWSRLQSQQQQHTGPATPIKREPDNFQPTAQLSADPQSSSGSRERTSAEQRPSSEKIKREPTEGEDVQPWKRPKTEFN